MKATMVIDPLGPAASPATAIEASFIVSYQPTPIKTSVSVAIRFAGVIPSIHDPTIACVSFKEAEKAVIASE